jgi:hypothetical protein
VSELVARDNRARTDRYRKDAALEEAVREVNLRLAPQEPEAPADLPPVPHIFVFGLPRSGTTLTHQVLIWGLDVGYVSNVLARFWLAPHAGAVISDAVLGGIRDDSFVSDYGKSVMPAGGHEFAYFWQHWLGIEQVEDLLDFSGRGEGADWDGAAAAIKRIQAVFDKPLVFKTNYAAQFLPAFASHFPMPLFVHVTRDPLDVALSILEARRRYYDDASEWWSTYPPEYGVLAGRPPADQIAGQVVGLRRAYERQIAKAPLELTVTVDYLELCASPREALDRIRKRCQAVHGTAPDLLHPLPASFEAASRGGPRTAEEAAVAQALRRMLAETSG